MHLKFLAHGTGSARAAAKYLLGERDAAGKPREGVEVLRGGSERSGRRGLLTGVRAQVHLRRDRLGAGGPTDRRTDRRGSGRFRGHGLGRARTRPLRMGGRAAPRARRRRSRPCPRRSVRPGDRPKPQHRAAGLGEDLRPPPGRLQRRTRLGSPGRPGAGQGGATRPPRLHRGGTAAGRAPARSLTARSYWEEEDRVSPFPVSRVICAARPGPACPPVCDPLPFWQTRSPQLCHFGRRPPNP